MYQRFLNDKDYLAIITQDLLDQLVRDEHDRIPQAEQSAEMDIREYLDQYYEIEKVLEVGKSIRRYSPMVNYPPGVYFIKEEEVSKNGTLCNEDVIYRTISSIRGYKKPTNVTYWEKLETLPPTIDLEHLPHYYQTRSYVVGNIVVYRSEYWKCLVSNGADYNNIQIPGVKAWEVVSCEDWQPLLDYQLHDVVKYNKGFYTLINKGEGFDGTANPHESDDWGMIGEYSVDYQYDASEESYDYVVLNDIVYKPIINPNAEELVLNGNVVRDDPRNLNIIKHMTRIALYYLHQTISPTNISDTRRTMYEDSMNWLSLASKFKLNPQLPRKKDEKGEDKADWAVATFQKELDSLDNPWLT